MKLGSSYKDFWEYTPGGNVSVFATGLEYPRGLKFGPDGYLYVAEAGSGGTMSTDGTCDQVIPPVGPYLGGFTSRISKVAKNGTVSTVADNLPSGINALGDVLGIADVAFIGGTSCMRSLLAAAVLTASRTMTRQFYAYTRNHPVDPPTSPFSKKHTP